MWRGTAGGRMRPRPDPSRRGPRQTPLRRPYLDPAGRITGDGVARRASYLIDRLVLDTDAGEVKTMFSDYRLVGRVRLAFRQVTTDPTGQVATTVIQAACATGRSRMLSDRSCRTQRSTERAKPPSNRPGVNSPLPSGNATVGEVAGAKSASEGRMHPSNGSRSERQSRQRLEAHHAEVDMTRVHDLIAALDPDMGFERFDIGAHHEPRRKASPT